MQGKLVQRVNACLHLGRELLEVAIIERFIGNVVLGVHQGISSRRLRNTRCGGRLVLLTLCWAFLACHGALSLHAGGLSRYCMSLRYNMVSILSLSLAGICHRIPPRRIMHVSHCVTSHRACVPSSSRDGEKGVTCVRPTSRIAATGERMTDKKDKKARRLARKRKAQRHTPFSGQQILLNRVRASQHVPNTQVLVNPVGTEKMSEVIFR